MKLKPAYFTSSAYTLIEVLIVIGMISVISLITLAIINPSKQRSRVSDAVLKESVEKIASAMEVYKSVTGDYPTQITAPDMSRYIGEGYTIYIAGGLIAFYNESLETGSPQSSVYWDPTSQCLQAQSAEDPAKYISWEPGEKVNVGANCGGDLLPDDADIIASLIDEDVGPGDTTVVYTPPSGSGGGGGSVAKAMIANYKLDEGSGVAVSDSKGHYSGSLVNAPEWIDGASGNAIDLSGASQYAQISGLLGRPASITISAWVNVKVPPSSWGYEAFSIGDVVAIRIRQNGVHSFYYGMPAEGGGTSWVSTDTNQSIVGTGWRHVAYTVDTTNHIQKVYVDGSLQATSNYTQIIRYSDLGANTYIGRHGNSSVNYFFNGAVDNIKVYNYALTQEEISVDYGEFTPLAYIPMARLKFEETTGDIAYDASGNRTRGNIGGGAICPGGAACPVSGIGHTVGNAFTFDGVDDYVDMGDVLDQTGSFTIMAWIKPDNTTLPGSQRIIVKDNLSSGWALSLGDSAPGKVRFFIRGTSGTFTDSTTDLLAGQWYHVAAVFDTTADTRTIYINGIPSGESTSVSGNPVANASSLGVGKDPAGVSGVAFDGMIDNVEILDIALTQAQIQTEMNK